MKFLLQILFLLFTWFNLSATTAFSKVALPNQTVFFHKTTNQNQESEVKNGVSNFARSGILENSFSQKAVLWESFVLENRAREENVNVVSGAGSLVSKLTGIAKNAHENLLLGGVKFIDDGVSIKYLTKNGAEFAKIENGKILLTKADGKWPLPSEYLDANYISTHLSKFDGGVTKITSYNPTGSVGPPGGTFVLPKSQADLLIQQAGGDVNKLEDLLGLKRGDLGTNPFRIDINNPSGLRMPSGNEAGANEFWIPGGKTSGRILEATVDQIQLGSYVKKTVF